MTSGHGDSDSRFSSWALHLLPRSAYSNRPGFNKLCTHTYNGSIINLSMSNSHVILRCLADHVAIGFQRSPSDESCHRFTADNHDPQAPVLEWWRPVYYTPSRSQHGNLSALSVISLPLLGSFTTNQNIHNHLNSRDLPSYNTASHQGSKLNFPACPFIQVARTLAVRVISLLATLAVKRL